MFDVLLAIIGFLVVLMPLIFVHEYGHFWAARRAGIHVEVFSIGFGKELFAFTDRKNTRWQVAAIPFGGFVRMAGEHDLTGRVADDKINFQPGDFLYASVIQRMFVVVAGPLANFGFAILLFAALFLMFGKAVTPTQVDVVGEGSAAEVAGILVGDRITAINGHKVEEFVDIQYRVVENPGREISVTLVRDGQEITLPVIPDSLIQEETCTQYGSLGIGSLTRERRTYNPLSAVVVASEETYSMVNLIFRALGRIITGNVNKGEFGGPIKIAEVSGAVFKNGVTAVLVWTALLSINLGLLNLLPIPVLDGGHLLFFAIEGVTGRRFAPIIQDWIMRFGVAFLVGLMILMTLFDIQSWLFPLC